MTKEEIVLELSGFSQKSYRASQVYSWIVKGVTSFEEMINLPKDLKQILKDNYCLPCVRIKDKRVSSDGTIKYLFQLNDNEFIESVLMKYNYGYSICISTQVGCKMGCSFCSTGKTGFARNLNASEMISQIELAQKDNNIRISNVVLMGMGEPLDNYDNVMRFLNLVSSQDHINIGQRHISLSTCGLVDKIYRLAKKKMQITLSVSLHASNDCIRSKMMRINNRWNISELIEACKYYISQTGRRISFEYAMVNNVNDTPRCACELADLLKGMLCHVNLIPLNESYDGTLKKSSTNNVYKFKSILEKKGISTTIRRTLGQDIEAACGQLKRKHIAKEVKE